MGSALTFLKYAFRRKKSPADYLRFQQYQGQLIIEALERHRDLRKKLRVLDVGSGVGGYVYEMARTRNVEIVSLDKNPLPPAIERYREVSKSGKGFSLKYKKKAKVVYTSNKIVVVEGDITDAPFSDKSFDIIIASGVIEHVPDQDKMISECYRLLKDDGLFYLSFPPYYSPVGGHSISPLHYIPGKFPLWLYKRQNIGNDPAFRKYYGLVVTTLGSVERMIKGKFVVVQRRARVFDFLTPFLKIPLLREFISHHVEFFLVKQ